MTSIIPACGNSAIIEVAARLHEAVLKANIDLSFIPDYKTIEVEAAAIERVSRPVDDLAAQILALTPTTQAEIDAYVRAEAWEAGRYTATYLRWAA